MSGGASGGAGYAPMRWSRSARFTAVARTRTRTSPLEGSGSGRSTTVRTSGPPNFAMAIAFIRGLSRGFQRSPPATGAAATDVDDARRRLAARREHDQHQHLGAAEAVRLGLDVLDGAGDRVQLVQQTVDVGAAAVAALPARDFGEDERVDGHDG